MEEESRKRRERSECDCNAGEKRPRTLAADDVVVSENNEQEEDMMAWLTLDEETVTELSKLLDSSEAPSTTSFERFNFKVKFSDDPYMSPVIVQSSSAYVTINGNEESCGSSFSDSESSVMASIDRGNVRTAVVGLGKCCYGNELNSCGAWGSDAVDSRGWVEGFLVRDFDASDMLGGGYHIAGSVDDDDDDEDDLWVKFLGGDLFSGSW